MMRRCRTTIGGVAFALLAVACGGAMAEEAGELLPQLESPTQSASAVLPTAVQTASLAAAPAEALGPSLGQTPSLSASQSETWKAEIDGRKTWTVRYGLGDSLALAGASLASGQLVLEQTLVVDMRAEALSVLSVEGHFNDQESASLQSLVVLLDTETLDGRFGDFTAPSIGAFSAYSRKMKGARLDAFLGDITVTGIASRLEGVRESRTFVGETASGERTFTSEDGTSYAMGLDGLAHFDLRAFFVPEFDDVRLRVDSTPELSQVFSRFGAGDLLPAVTAHAGRVLQESEFDVVGSAPQSLLLRSARSTLVRETLRDAIREYNATAAVGATRLVYPFVTGSEVETAFLTAVVDHSALQIAVESYRLRDAGRRRFFSLGQKAIVAGSVAVAVRLDGDEFVPLDDERASGYSTRLFEDAGIVEVRFPATFFELPGAAFRASFRYEVAGGVYTLGLGVLPGSERVTLDGRLLAPDADYIIDYEIGVVSLTSEISQTAVLVIDFERQSGGLGGVGGYARYFTGVTVDWPASDVLTLDLVFLTAFDDRGSLAKPDGAKTMPNRQMVAGVIGNVRLDDFSAAFTVGMTDDRFPFDDNARRSVANVIRTIALGEGLVLVGHDAGFSVLAEESWHAFTSANGLSGREVRAAYIAEGRAFLGTEGGLTVVDLIGTTPFDRVANWKRFGEREGLPDASVRSLLVADATLWVGGDGRVVRVALDEMADPSAWMPVDDPATVGANALVAHAGAVYAGTERGLTRMDRESSSAEPIDAGIEGAVYALASDGAKLYAGCDRGVRVIVGDVGVEWIETGAPVRAVAVVAGRLVYGGDAGLFDVAEGASHAEWTITALAAEGGVLWAGTAARDDEIVVWRRGVRETETFGKTMKVAASNPYRFEDIAARDHSSQGWTARASFDHTSGALALSGSVDRTLPGYRGIDVLSRRDEGGWALDGELDLGSGAALTFAHEYTMSDLASPDRRAFVDNEFTISGAIGPRLSLSIRHRGEDTEAAIIGSERDEWSYRASLGHQLFGDALRVDVTWNEGATWRGDLPPDRTSALGATAALTLGTLGSSTLSWSRPVRASGPTRSGSESLTWATKASLSSVSGLSISAGHTFSASRPLSSETSTRKHTAESSLSVGTFSLCGASISPTAELSASWGVEGTDLGGRLSVRSVLGRLSGRTVLSADVSGVGERVTRWTERLNSTWNLTEVSGWRPTITYTGTRSVTQADGREQASMTHAVSGRVSWTGDDGSSDALSASLRWQTNLFTATIDNTYQRDVSAWFAGRNEEGDAAAQTIATLRLLSAGDVRQAGGATDANWTLGGAVDLRWSASWSLSFVASYRGSVRKSGGAAHGVTFSLTAAVDF